MRLSSGPTVLRGDLRLDQQGRSLHGTLSLETSDTPPVAIEDGRVAGDGQFEFSVPFDEPVQVSGHRAGASLAGQLTFAHGQTWAWTADRLPDDLEFYTSLPRFRARELILGRNVNEFRLPGAWVAAAAAVPGAARRSAELAAAAGLQPIPEDSVLAYGFLPALGLLRREDLLPAMVAALTAIRGRLPAASQREFDALFRPRRVWIVDLHDAALAAARRRSRGVSWEDTRAALAAVGLLATPPPAGTAEIPLALYHLATLRDRDSAAFEALRVNLPLGGFPSAQATETLLEGYREAADWQAQAVSFLLSADWVTDGSSTTSPTRLMRAAWGRPDLDPPVIVPRYFGIPDAVPRVGTPPAVIGRIVAPENWSGEQWVGRHGPAALLGVVRALDPGLAPTLTLEDEGPWGLTSVAREAAATAGFLETSDAIVEDPGAPPLFAVATAMHEWQHLVMERERLLQQDGGTVQPDGPGLRIVTSDIFLAEGFAGWMADRVLAPVFASLPIVGVGDAEKLAFLEAVSPVDPHVLGLQMIDVLAAATRRPDEVRRLVVAHAAAPAEIAAAIPAWRDAGVPDRVVPTRGQRRLVPEIEFTIEDAVGDIVGSRILVPSGAGPAP